MRKKGLTPEEVDRVARELRELQAQVREMIAYLEARIRERGSGT